MASDTLLDITENQLRLVVERSPVTGTSRLLHLSPLPFDPATIPESENSRRWFSLVEVQRAGEDQAALHGSKHVACNPGGPSGAPIYVSHRDSRNASGRLLEFTQEAGPLRIRSFLQFFDGLPVVRSWTTLENIGSTPIPLEHVSSFALTGLAKDSPGSWDHDFAVHVPFSAWTQEFQWQSFKLPELGLPKIYGANASTSCVAFSNTGSYAAKETLPMGCLVDNAAGVTHCWQIESHGSWVWELAEVAGQLYLQLSGPTDHENHWFKNLRPGESFTSVPVAVAILKGAPEDAFAVLNQYRRRIRRPNADNRELPVIFNDYMNCLEADPTLAKELPLIDQAAALGAEFYVIDAGWYAEGAWWDYVGEWKVSTKRFPNGLEEVLAYIVDKGMRPGLWLELERMGKNCPLASQWPAECFFRRHGQRVVENKSLQLDFRHDVVRRHADAVVDRLVGKLGVKFIKMDYNIEIGPGTEVDADSFGDGALQHQRAYLDWLDAVLERHPDLVIENCASGGMRNTYSLLSRLSLCSTTDNADYRHNTRISINCATGYCMEQAGVWVAPKANPTDEAIAFSMAAALSWRPYLSGQVMTLGETGRALLREGVELYKNHLRKIIPTAQPFWPLGLVKQDDAWSAFGLRAERELILSVWRFDGGPDEISIPFPAVQSVELLYPKALAANYRWDATANVLHVALSPNTARVFRLQR